MRLIRQLSEYVPNPSVQTGFVPTMGALHEGHLELMRRAKAENDKVVVSVFVNPTQFGPHEDFQKYPRMLERDCDLAKSVGVDCVLAPSTEDICPENFTSIHVSGVTDAFEGVVRPGHFDGVCLVVAKLFNIVMPNRAYFGSKDLQQCAVIRRMVLDLNFRLELRIVETIREADGLAMSSRNAYLSHESRQIAPVLFASLRFAAQEIANLEQNDATNTQIILNSARNRIIDAGFTLDYLDLVDENTMKSISCANNNARIVVAARIEGTRLIDNVPIFG